MADDDAAIAEKDARTAEYGGRWAPSVRMQHEIDFEAGWIEAENYFRQREETKR